MISVNTLWLEGATLFPLYIEVAPYRNQECSPDLTGRTVLVAHGARQCGGTTESIGPLDLTLLDDIGLGELYYVQAVFFQTLAPPYPLRYSVAMSCISVAPAPTAVEAAGWSRVKSIYR